MADDLIEAARQLEFRGKAAAHRADRAARFVNDPPSEDSRQTPDDIIPDKREIEPLRKPEEMTSTAPTFNGKPGTLKNVLLFVELKSKTNASEFGATDTKAALLGSLFRGKALGWLGRASEARPALLEDFTLLKEEAKKAFEPSEASQKQFAYTKFVALRQTTSVLAYNLQFQDLAVAAQLITDEGNDDDVLRAQYLRGLKLHVREGIVISGKDQSPLTRLYAEAQRIDDELYAAKRYTKGAGTKQGSSGGAVCWSCGKPGHKSRDCKSKQSGSWDKGSAGHSRQ